jgi:UDP-N-acetylmuramate dehydrogenase
MTLSSDPITTLASLKSSFSAKSSQTNPVWPRAERSVIPLPGTGCFLKANVPLSSLTSFRVGGPAEWYVAPRHFDELQASMEWARSQGLALTMLGNGSNLLISDRGLGGLVISTRYLRRDEFDASFDHLTGRVTVGSGEQIPRLAWQLAEMGWQGFEWAVGIPGTVGGAVVMNAGAHSHCVADLLVNTEVLLPNGTTQILLPSELDYRYRTSNLQGGDRLVTRATFQLRPGADPAQVLALTTNHENQRHTSQPYDKPSCGSVFRNPDAYKAGWLIEQTGLKGYKIGGAQVAQRHANFILNCGGATATDIFQLIRYVQRRVEQQWSLCLEPEVKILGEFQAG